MGGVGVRFGRRSDGGIAAPESFHQRPRLGAANCNGGDFL